LAVAANSKVLCQLWGGGECRVLSNGMQVASQRLLSSPLMKSYRD
jgi:hypothetical protein